MIRAQLIRLTIVAVTIVAVLGVLIFFDRTANAGAIPAPNATQTCASTDPCQTFQNTSSGNAVQALSTNGTAIDAQTTHTHGPMPAILGEDKSTKGKDIGVEGLSPNGIGVRGEADSRDGSGVAGYSLHGSGICGISGAVTSKICGEDLKASVVGLTETDSTIGVFASSGPYIGAWAQSESQFPALLAAGNAGSAIEAHGGFSFNNIDYPILELDQSHQPSDMIIASNFNQTDVFAVGQTGNIRITGEIFTAGSCSSGCLKGRDGSQPRVVSYAPSQSQPSMEDFGEARLVNGRASVQLDPAFANVIDAHSSYLVFITPEGDSRGLYVTSKTHAGFEVVESQGGRSTLAFQYRIVAKPFGNASRRLPMVDVGKKKIGAI